MRSFCAIAILLMCSNAMSANNGTDADYSVAITSTGINLYSISNNGLSLVKGSPFQPNPAIPDCGAPSGPATSPIMIALSPEHDFVYALYSARLLVAGNCPATLVGYKIKARKLVQQWSAATGIGGGGHHSPSVSALIAGRNSAIVDWESPETSPADMYAAKIYNQSGQLVMDARGYVVSAEQGFYLQFLSAHVDPQGAFVYICTTGTPTSQAVYVYGIESGAFAGKAVYPFSDPILLQVSNDATFVQGKCD